MKKPTMKKVRGQPLKGDTVKSEKVTVRIESKEKSLLIKKFGSISAGIDHLLKNYLKE